ncbi:MAG TPA: aminoglycoside 6-adenylyltransferase [Chitinophaga sp.]|uniref:aminoglycoside 6-adenylyltransferase n=1 Tax=Chitinophaga sp. TaxID=1869181 RepID=UPI002CA2595E|nr:aminoglycoside 6-adenylyltransferase [Chitinophaga sp.]HVI48084.1 aminoglycoside 6-adenylyltransferase [Chitinophaga sp.]
MKGKQQLLRELISWGQQHNAVRAMLLTSSRANPTAPVDLFTDHDIDLVVEDHTAFLADDSWLSTFGDIMAVIVEEEEVFDGACASRMVLYDDYTKIDFLIFSIEQFNNRAELPLLHEDWDIGYEVLLDKDGLTAMLPPPSYKSFTIQPPDEQRYLHVITEVWWDMSYAAKCLWRDEIFYAKLMTETMMRFEKLQYIIEWYIAMQHSWQVTTNKYGRLFKKYLDSNTWNKTLATFSDADIEGNWNALFAYAELVRELGTAIADNLGFSYPQELDRKMMVYLEKVRKLDRNATDIV